MEKKNNGLLFERARNYAFLLLKFRLRTEEEIRSRMKQKKFPADVIKATIDFLKDKKFIDDGLFARAWLDSRLKRSMGLRRVKNELKLKGVKPSLIEETIASAKHGYNEDEAVADLISRKSRGLKGLDARKVRQRIYAFLMRRGFSPDVIADNLNKMPEYES